MFKKIEIWVLYLLLVFVFISYIIFGSMVIREHENGHYIPVISPISKLAHFIALIPRNIRDINHPDVKYPHRVLEERFGDQFSFKGDANIDEKYLLLSRFDGDIEEGIVELVDLQNFDVLHTWNPNIDNIFNGISGVEWEDLSIDKSNKRTKLNHPLLFEDGSLLVQYNTPLMKIGKNSDLELIKSDEIYHHSAEFDNEGNVWICVEYFPYKVDSKFVGNKFGIFKDDGIRKLSPSGKVLFDKSVSNILIENNMEYLVFASSDRFKKDPIHLNDIQPVEEDNKYWKKGDIFLSLRNLSMVLLYRPETNQIIWKSKDNQFFNQHDINILDDRRISIFDNNVKTNYKGNFVDGHNRIVIYDFEKEEYLYYLNESLKKEDVRTSPAGRGKILPNGDLFIEETDFGRTLYFNSDGSLRWSHVNRSKDNYIQRVGWSRILYKEEDIRKVNKFIKNINRVSNNAQN